MNDQRQDVEADQHDTVDIEEDLDEIDALLSEDTVPVAQRGRRVGVVEFLLVGIANVIWGVVGLVLWLPQAFRAVLGAALRVTHSALTNQRSDRAVAGIKQVSGLYFDRFLRRRGEPVFVGRRHELRPFRLIAEMAWVVVCYLLLLRWLAPSVFHPIWQRLVSWAGITSAWPAAAGSWLSEWWSFDPTNFTPSRLQAGGVLLAVALVCAALGFWLGRRKG